MTGKISKLPPYLLMHFVRFYWRHDIQAKAKICRNVAFPFAVDMMPYLRCLSADKETSLLTTYWTESTSSSRLFQQTSLAP